MSVLGINKLTLDLEHKEGTLHEFKQNPELVLDRYRLTEDERSAITRLDAEWLLTTGANPIVLRNLLVILGIPHKQMYTHGS